ncbi:MAG: threonine synthase [Betaproteobacteria bacterium]|nr:threonine synthase [Betaproteobacteria bacterium]MDH5286432.1 threonine synthase [Betaproteobacteria bacterium]
MRYVSTRGAWAANPQPFRAILLEGLALDGGLAVPESYPRFSAAELDAMRGLDYRGLALAVLSRFFDDIPAVDLKRLIDATYTKAAFGSDEIVPLSTLAPGLHLLHASNGPTLAFKDIALQLLGRLFEHVLGQTQSTLNILGATSGDTGSSAEHALLGRRGVRVFMLSPHGRMSPFQQAQMYSLLDPAIHNLAIEGSFDDCQDIVKAVSGDAEFKRRYRIGAVNSINWARVAAQVVYYFKGCFAATSHAGEAVQFAVPSGNFGNILAAHVARAMGLPIARLVLATNENDVLDEFFRTGRYRPRSTAETRATSSPSMDISKASNFERFVFDVVGRDARAFRSLWDSLARDGEIDFAATPWWPKVQQAGIVSGRSTHAERVATIRELHERYGVVIDPHTADGVKVGREQALPGVPLVCVETALPAKFAATIREAIGRDPERPAAFVGLEERPQRCEVLPPDVERVKAYVAAHAAA